MQSLNGVLVRKTELEPFCCCCFYAKNKMELQIKTLTWDTAVFHLCYRLQHVTSYQPQVTKLPGENASFVAETVIFSLRLLLKVWQHTGRWHWFQNAPTLKMLLITSATGSSAAIVTSVLGLQMRNENVAVFLVFFFENRKEKRKKLIFQGQFWCVNGAALGLCVKSLGDRQLSLQLNALWDEPGGGTRLNRG